MNAPQIAIDLLMGIFNPFYSSQSTALLFFIVKSCSMHEMITNVVHHHLLSSSFCAFRTRFPHSTFSLIENACRSTLFIPSRRIGTDSIRGIKSAEPDGLQIFGGADQASDKQFWRGVNSVVRCGPINFHRTALPLMLCRGELKLGSTCCFIV